MGNYRMCVCFTRKFKISQAEPPLDVKIAFKKYSSGGINVVMTADQLRQFLVDVQGFDAEATTVDVADKLIEQIRHKRHHHHHHHHHIPMFTKNATLTLDDFHHFLFSVDLNPPIGSQVHQDMTAPLNHYFIYTGHNSYLTGNQLSSDCSDKPIVKALNRGVRVIELDIWPNSTRDNVNVLHGRTLTTPVELLKCLKSIKDHAFSSSPYPVVITLEDHLTPDLQAKVAQMLTQTFGKMLFQPKSDNPEDIPSPQELKYRIIVSTKPPKEYLEAKSFNEKGKNGDLNQESVPLEPPDYKRLIAIHAGKPKGGLKKALKVEHNKIRRLSLSEQALEKVTECHGTDAVRFTQKNFLRIYPKGTRINSSNYKPLIGWMHGAQMVAFNMQGYGRNLWLMHGMFRSNGGCGYVKKPDFLMNVGPDDQVFDPKAKLPVKKTLKVKVYTGDGWHLDFKQTHFDLYSPPDFYTRVGIAGVPADEIMKKTKTKENTWTPIWDEEFSFPLTVPELALLRIEVHEYDMSEKDHFAGQTCLPVSELKPGIRAVPLFNRKGEQYNSVRLLLRFEFV